MVSIMVNKIAYNPSVKDIMDKYYEMFRGKNSVNKKTFSTIPTAPSTPTKTRTEMGELD